ncbi:unnamed protein product [Sphagnum jensenii]|uniref:Uncharacterized protein n=1 Tax=Sphagnum jensenii TaxID=128206 RepID=A0ABP1A6V2_9BRYO
MNSEREGEEEGRRSGGTAMKARERREGRKTKSSLYHCLLGHRPADDPRCVRRTFPGTHGRASLLSPAVPGDAVGRTD